MLRSAVLASGMDVASVERQARGRGAIMALYGSSMQ
jgi:hypothetical protein